MRYLKTGTGNSYCLCLHLRMQSYHYNFNLFMSIDETLKQLTTMYVNIGSKISSSQYWGIYNNNGPLMVSAKLLNIDLLL